MANFGAFGDSVSIGFGLSDPTTELYLNQVVASISRTLVNKSSSGDMAADQSMRAYNLPPTTAEKYSVLVGINDAQLYGTDSTKLNSGFVPYMRGLISWVAQPNKTFGTNALMTKTGGWVANTSDNWVGVKVSASGAIASCRVSGSSVLIAGIIKNSSAAEGDATVRVDGATVGTISMRGTSIGNTLIGGSSGMAAWRFTGLGSGPHLVEVETTTTKDFYLDSITGSDQIAKPFVYVGDVIKRGATAYLNGNSDANVTTYCNAIAALIAEFSADGANVVGWGANSVINPATDLLADDIHPKASGHVKLTNALLAVM